MCFQYSQNPGIVGGIGRDIICDCVREADNIFRCRCFRIREDERDRRRFICRQITRTDMSGQIRRVFICTEVDDIRDFIY